MSKEIKIKKLAITLLFSLILTGCQIQGISENLKKADEKIGQELGKVEGLEDVFTNNGGEEKIITIELTPEVKEKIDQWLEENNLNRYGDPEDTMYAGGTPLFNESTGESVDRYKYILDNHSDLVEIISNL